MIEIRESHFYGELGFDELIATYRDDSEDDDKVECVWDQLYAQMMGWA